MRSTREHRAGRPQSLAQSPPRGRCLARSGDTGAGADHLGRALALYQRLNVPEAAAVDKALGSLRTGRIP